MLEEAEDNYLYPSLVCSRFKEFIYHAWYDVRRLSNMHKEYMDLALLYIFKLEQRVVNWSVCAGSQVTLK